MYDLLKGWLLALFKAPSGPPEPPSGSHASAQVFRASPRYLTYRLLVFWLACAVVALALGVALVVALVEGEVVGIAVTALAVPVVASVLFCAWFTVRLEYDLRYYVVTDRSLRVREGAWTVREMTITYANIQNLRVVQGPLQRLFGIYDLRVETAGGGASKGREHRGPSGHTLAVSGIENAREVRDSILAFVRSRPLSSGLGDPDEDHVGRSSGGPELTAALQRLLESSRALRFAAHVRASAG
jgi:membrane protein YdbS with pleckstrin-like domain